MEPKILLHPVILSIFLPLPRIYLFVMDPKPNSWVEVDLEALAFNCRQIRTRVGPKRKILAAVKANGYGHGIVQAAQAFKEGGADWFGVAIVREGIDLRKAGISQPILLLGGMVHDEVDALLEYDLTPNVVDLSIARALNDAAKQSGKKKRIHIKVDTGMGRTGVPCPDAREFIKAVHNLEFLEIEGLFMHFPCSDEIDKEFSLAQLENFRQLTKDLKSAGIHIPILHATNSGAILDLPDSYFDMVRAGIMLYGYYPSRETSESIEIRPAVTLNSRITFVKKVPMGTPLGYGRTYVTNCEQVIATVPIGYGDGYLRYFSNKATMIVNGVTCPVRGRVSMDQTLIDVTAAGPVAIGTVATVYSNRRQDSNSVENLSRLIGTIPYELTCALGMRLPRIYL